jgi:2-methylisocitrate lyase-like PEP mutase family enzyme
MKTQIEKAIAFRALHERDSAFIIPNPSDIGTARLLAHLGFEALATTSAGYAFSVGQRDNTIGRDQMMARVAEIVSATELPVSADLENGFGDDPNTVAETIRRAAAAGLVGASIEDATTRPSDPIYDHALAVERVRAAAVVARASVSVHADGARRELTWSAGRISTTRSNGCRPTKQPGRMSCMRQGCGPRKILPRWSARSSGL